MPDTPPGLRYADDSRPGITRRRRGKGFSYHRPDGELVADDVRERIEALAIPPAYEDVWICPHPNGHLQATGRDAKGRKQYRYHPDWEAHRNRLKFDRMVPFAEALPALRARVDRDLRGGGVDRETVLALCVRLLDETLIRVGNEQYAAENGSYGLTTIRDKHVTFEGSGVRLEFTGKSGKAQSLAVRDRRLAELVRACRDIPGYDLFQFYDEAGERHDVESGHVNAYIHEATGDAFSAKDFRTWGGTVTAAERLAAHGDDVADGDLDGLVVQAIKDTAEVLGNTPAVCRRYYVHPTSSTRSASATWRAGSRAGTPATRRPASARRRRPSVTCWRSGRGGSGRPPRPRGGGRGGGLGRPCHREAGPLWARRWERPVDNLREPSLNLRRGPVGPRRRAPTLRSPPPPSPCSTAARSSGSARRRPPGPRPRWPPTPRPTPPRGTRPGPATSSGGPGSAPGATTSTPCWR